MVVWNRSNPIKYGVAISKFEAPGPYTLPLDFGEAVLIYEETDTGEWMRGCSLLNRNEKGIFPTSFIHVKWTIDSQSQDDVDIAFSKELSTVLEITSVLQEWGEIWKQLFVKKAEETDKIRKLLQDLMSRRRQVLSGALTADQLKQVKSEIAKKIDYGNKLLGLDMVVRDSEGNVINVDQTGVIELYKMHLESAQRLEEPADSRKKKSPSSSYLQYNGHNLYVSVKNVVCQIDDESEVILTLYDGRDNAFISEHYMVSWTDKGMPKDLDKLHNMSCLFTDLGLQDLQRDKLYIVCQIIRYGKMDMNNKQSKKGQTRNLRRPFGVAVLHISDIVQGNVIEDEDKEYFLMLQKNVTGHDDLETLVKRSIVKTSGQQTGNEGIWLSLQKLHGDLQQVKEEHPLLVTHSTAIARKQGFPDVIMPGDIRNDMYLTLISGVFDKGRKTSLNMQVIVGIYDSNGQLLSDVISLGAGEPLVNEYFSTINYHSEQPRWGETVKFVLPIDKVTGCHVRFSFKHRATLEEKDRSQKIFSLSYINLASPDGTCLQDGQYELAVYRCEMKRLDDCNAYLKLPSLKSEVMSINKKFHSGGLTFSKSDMFKVNFQLCSTKLAQNVDLLGLLKWRSQKEKLPVILPALMKVSGQEIVKFLQDTFDALFGILMEDASRYGEMVANAVVFCIGLLADKKYHRFRSILDTYIENLFSSTKAYITLVDVLQKHIEGIKDIDLAGEKREIIIRYYKALEYLIKFIVRSRSLSERAAPGKGRLEFEASIMNLFSAIMNTMKVTDDEFILPLQGCALKYVPAVFGDLLEVFDAEQLGYFARDLVEKTSPNKLQTQKLAYIHHLVRSPLFFNPVSRNVIRPMLVGQLRLNMTKFDDLKTCADILNEMLMNFDSDSIGDISEDVSYLVTSLFHCILLTVIQMNLSSPLFGNYVAFIISILDLMEDDHYIEYVDSYEDDSKLLDCLMELFLLFREFIKEKVYAEDWMSMTMVQNNVILRALQKFSNVLYDRFLVGESFNFQLWSTFFQLSVIFVTQDPLQLEMFSEAKRRKILERYSDMRMVIAGRIVDMWQYLGINKIRLIQSMVKPFLEMTLVPETELRRTTIPIFYDMIECEYRSKQHFRQVESELIMHLDSLIESGMKGDEEYKELFHQILSEKFHQERIKCPGVYDRGMKFVETISKLLSRLLDYRSVIQSEDNINNRMSCTVNILNFYQDIKREDMKQRYLYKLCDLHLSVNDYTEAAFTLLQHAEILKWSEEPPISSTITGVTNRYDAKTQRELKERLYKDIIDYFDKGKMWEYGIRRCKELAEQYETETYDYIQLSQILEKQAKFFENIMKTAIRPEPTYFRVGYYGRGFPTFLKNKVFIYRGNEYEQVGAFKMRLQIQFPGAQFLKVLTPPGPEVKESLKQWIQMYKVDPKPVERRKFRGRNISNQITKFYEVNDVSEFTLSRPFHKGVKDKENEFATLWIERTSMTTKDSFPGKLRWFEVETQNSIELSPIETAIDTLTVKNKEILSMCNRYAANPKIDLNPFTMLLNGVIDAAVMGGISNYERIFFSSEYLSKNPEHIAYIDRIKELIVEQVDICEKGLKIHKGLVTPQLQPLHEKMEDIHKKNKAKANPYRKKQNDAHSRRSIFPDGAFNQSPVQRRITHSSERPRSDANIIASSPISRRGTHIPNQASTLMHQEKSNRHTTIVGPSSPIHAMIPSNDMDNIDGGAPPALPGRDTKRSLNRSTSASPMSSSSALPAPLPPKGSQATLSRNGYDTVPSVPLKDVTPPPLEIPKRAPVAPAPYNPDASLESPKPPPKPMSRPPLSAPASHSPSILPKTNNNNQDLDDDEKPPIIPPKTKTLTNQTSQRSPPPPPPLDSTFDKVDEDSEEAPPLPRKGH